MVGEVEIYIWFKEWFNFMFMKKHVKHIWLKIVVQFNVGNIIA